MRFITLTWKRALGAAALLTLSACTSYEPGEPRPGAPPLPVSGPIAYRCANGTQLMVDFENNQARVAIVGADGKIPRRRRASSCVPGPSQVSPSHTT